MNEPSQTVEQKIILATIDAIERYGLSGANNRRIAEIAGVNLAAINYYFRSKDALIQRVMDLTLTNAFDLSDFPPMPGASCRERCAAVMLHLIEGGYQYPGLTRAHFYSLLAEGREDPNLVGHINRFIDTLALDLQSRGCPLPPDALKTALVQILSAVMLPILSPTLFAPQPNMDLRDEPTRRTYVERLVAGLLTE